MSIEKSLKFISLIAISLFFLPQKISSQPKGWISEIEMASLDNLSYNKPVGFEEVMGDDCFENNPKLKEIIHCGGNQLLADDESSIIFIMFNSVYTIQPENEPLIIPPAPTKNRKSEFTPETYFMFFVKQDLIQALTKEDASQWRDHLKYYSKKYTTNQFNADLAFSYEIPLESKDYYKGKYNNLRVLFLAKDGGFLRMYCFYKDMPREELVDFKTKIEGTFRYQG